MGRRFLFFLLLLFFVFKMGGTPPKELEMKNIALPAPRTKGIISLEEAMTSRRSVRAYRKEALSIAEVGQLLWAAQGITNRDGLRTTPSAGALFPLETYLVVGVVNGVEPGVYRYNPHRHEIVLLSAGDKRKALSQAALGQPWISAAPVTILFAARFDRITPRYGERGIRYTYLEAGHAAQNVYLQATVLRLGTVAIGAFDDEAVKKALDLPASDKPVYFLPIGKLP